MPLDPGLIRGSARYLIRGSLGLLVDEVKGAYRRRGDATDAPDPRALIAAALPAMDVDMQPLPDLDDDTRLGDSLGTPGGTPPPDLPDDLFAPVVGLAYEKRVLRRVAQSRVPLHALMVGPPGGAKSLMLDELRRLPGSRYVVGRNMSAAGLIQMMTGDDPPRLLLVEEIDRAEPSTQSALQTVMDGKATRVVSGKAEVEEPVDVRVVAACNSTRTLLPSLLTRFMPLELPELTAAEREEVIAKFLTMPGHHHLDAAQAAEIAKLVAGRGGDTRDAAQIAHLWQTDQDLAREMATRLGDEVDLPPPPPPAKPPAAPRPSKPAPSKATPAPA